MAHLVRILTLLFGLSNFATVAFPTPAICNEKPYGVLHIQQCLTLYRTFANRQDNQLRIFDEEQLQEVEGRSWPGIINPFKTRVVQVPRLWTNRTC